MALVLLGTAMFLTGVVLIASLQWIAGKLARPLHLPMDVVSGVLHGVGFLITMPFVFSILLEARVSILTSMIVGAAILLCSALSFGFSLFRLLIPVLKAESARG